uniref:PDZ domain-containing protein n=1 Tax=Helobdella robusta TaxID=6412 RepID=T1G096_HELRO
MTRDEVGLGFTVAGGRGSTPYKANDQSIYISRISKGGAAEQEGSLRVGDKLVSVNGIDVTTVQHDEAVTLLTRTTGPILLIVTRSIDQEGMTPANFGQFTVFV